MASLQRDGDVFILDLGDDENRFNPDSVGSINAALDEIEAAEGPKAVVTRAEGKFWSNGLDLAWMGENFEQVPEFVNDVHGLLARVLLFPAPTVAAIQGHCYAAGAMLAQGHDCRVMRADRGYWCTPEVDIKIPFTPGMTALLQARLPKKTAHEAMVLGRRYGGEDALQAGIVDAAVADDKVFEWAMERAGALVAKDAATLGKIKERMYGDAAALLRDAAANGFGD